MIVIELPRRVVVCLAAEWLTGYDLSALDVAMTNHDIRYTFWALVSQSPPFHFNRQFLRQIAQKGSSLLHFIMWTIYRGLHFHSLFITQHHMITLAALPYFRFRDCQSLHMLPPSPLADADDLWGSDEEARLSKMSIFMSFLPDLDELDCSSWTSISDNQLLAIIQGCRPLHMLDLSGCLDLSPMCLCEVLRTMGGYLRSLKASCLDDTTLLTLSLTCQYLISLSFSRVAASEDTLHKAMSQLKRLTSLQLINPESMHSCVYHELLHHLPLLQTLDLSLDLSADPSVITDALLLCPKLQHLSLKHVTMSCHTEHQQRIVEVVFDTPCSREYLLEVLVDYCKLPVRAINTLASGVELSQSDLSSIAEAHGEALESVVCDLDSSLRYSHALLDCLVLQCPRLRVAGLSRCWGPDELEKENLTRLCPRLLRLHLSDSPVVSPKSMVGRSKSCI